MIDYEPRSYLQILTRIEGSVLPAVLPRTLITTGLGVVAWYAHHMHTFKLPNTVHSMVGVALGLLLVFRTNASYDRWWEGRKLLGSIVNRTRDLNRQAGAYLPAKEAAEVQRFTSLWYALLRQHLRRERDLSALGMEVTAKEKEALEPANTRPAVAVAWISETLARAAKQGGLTEPRLQLMDGNLTALADAWGGCERILRTPVPFAYAHHIKSFLVLFLFTMPFVIVDTMGLATPVACMFVGYGLFGIEEIGVEIEDPFGYDPNDLPLDRIGATIDGDTRLLAEYASERQGPA